MIDVIAGIVLAPFLNNNKPGPEGMHPRACDYLYVINQGFESYDYLVHIEVTIRSDGLNWRYINGDV